MRKKNVTISDIAEKTGYSKTTVSFAFNWPNRISAEAVSRIMECAKELGYQTNNDQLQDSANRYKTICILVPEINPPGSIPIWAKPLFGIYKECATHGFMFSMIDIKRSSDPFFLKYSAVDAFMVLDENVDQQLYETARKRKIPVIKINFDVEGATEEARKSKIVDNAVECVNMLFDLIHNGDVAGEPKDRAYKFFEKNL